MKGFSVSGLIVTLVFPAALSVAQPIGEVPSASGATRLICSELHAKEMPKEFLVDAMVFTGPAGDGRRGSAGFVVPMNQLAGGSGSLWQFTFRRDASGFGFQVIHPFGDGQVVVSVVGSTVSFHRGGDWDQIGWGNPATSDQISMTAAGDEMLPLLADKSYSVTSQLSVDGNYRMWIDGSLVCTHRISGARPLRLVTSPKSGFWLGSGWDRTSFAGKHFRADLKPGEGGLILGPMDGSGPRQRFENITLARLATTEPSPAAVPSVAPSPAPKADLLNELLSNIDERRQSGRVARTGTVGGSRGGSFVETPEDPVVLVGLMYTASRHYAGHLTIKAIRPIFHGRQGEVLGQWHGRPSGKVHQVKAKEGYVVAGMIAKWGNRLDGLRLIFMGIEDGRLNPELTYRSAWIGGLRGSPETLCGLTGNPIIGVFGRQGADLDSLGFVQAQVTKQRSGPPSQSLESLMPSLVGNWLVTYTNQTQHTRRISSDQSVNDGEEIVQENGDVLIVFPDVIERVTVTNGRLLVEHFNPSSTYPDGAPATMGVGHRQKQ